ncbi:hypothetical protein SEA_ARAXXI_22 [Microbacterium phage Araxxi]|uniref:Lipoprotein n=1 Tax=Microbacterium phage Araxxi TaxID=2590948 RepID=A0A516KT27_9CAUD|nr:hypothetical protein HWC57_gp22 [Microbacterium phage Araxxi]QDP44841.1 hypothetical protein SEA_ARAXXI_22 [Microbacterium phage Araxxi]
MKVKALLAVLLLLVLTGCSSISQGYVTGKEHQPGFYYFVQQCVGYNTNGTCRQWMPVQMYQPERWILHLQEDEDTGWVNVTVEVYDEYDVGDYYPE